MECLVSLARNYKRTVIMTIHQPRSNIYALFDQLLLLAKGKVIYSGPAQDEAIQHFKSMGYECPLGFNLADYLVDLTMHAIKVDTEEVTPLIVEPDKLSPTRSLNRLEEFIVSPSPSRLSIQHQQEEVLFTPKLGDMSLSHIPSLYETEAISQDVSLAADSQNELLAGIAEPLKSTAKLDGLVQKYYTSSVSVRINRFIQEQQSAGNPGNLPVRLTSHRATWWTQIKLLSGRNLKNLIRNPGLLRAQYLITFFVAILIGSLYWKVKNDIGGFQNRLGLFYFSCIFLGFTCIASIYVRLFLFPCGMYLQFADILL